MAAAAAVPLAEMWLGLVLLVPVLVLVHVSLPRAVRRAAWHPTGPRSTASAAVAAEGCAACAEFGVLNKQCRSGNAVGSGGAAVRPWQWEPQWGSPARDDSTRGMRFNTQKSARRAARHVAAD